MTIDQLISTGAIAPSVASATPAPSGPGFSEQLKSAIESVNDRQIEADGHLQAVASGQDVDLHTTMIALQEADITLRAMVSVRDKVVDAYQQIMNMSI